MKGDGSGVVKREGEDGGVEVEEEWEKKGSAKCVDCGEKQANYGFEDGKRRFCAACGKKRGAVSIQNKCVDCKLVVPSYKLPGEKVARYCAPCGKAKGAVQDRLCKDCGKKAPKFGQPGGSASFCGDCAPLHGAFNFALRCKTCNKRGPTHGTADQLVKKGIQRHRRWCSS